MSAWDGPPKDVGVDTDIAGKTEDTLAQDVAHDLGGPAFDGGGSRTEEPPARGRLPRVLPPSSAFSA